MAANALLADQAFDADERVIKPLEAVGKTARNFLTAFQIVAVMCWLN
jgi:hypothetical protein